MSTCCLECLFQFCRSPPDYRSSPSSRPVLGNTRLQRQATGILTSACSCKGDRLGSEVGC
eukprot:scaffold1629_cov369-Prasinococcus_capsulatus_cf.AAC.16